MSLARLLGVFVGCLIYTTAGLGSASAATVDMTYSDRSTWLGDIGGSADFLEDFNSFTTDTSFVSTPLDLNGFTLQATEESGPTGGNKIDVDPYGPGISTPSGTNTTPQANIQLGRFASTGDENTVTMTFDTAVSAWGASFEEIGISSAIELMFIDGTTQLLMLPESQSFGPEFLGFRSQTTNVTKITFMVGFLSNGNPIFGGFGGLMDNVEGDFGSAVVPLPAAFPLLAGGLGLLGLLGWKRRRKVTA